MFISYFCTPGSSLENLRYNAVASRIMVPSPHKDIHILFLDSMNILPYMTKETWCMYSGILRWRRLSWIIWGDGRAQCITRAL